MKFLCLAYGDEKDWKALSSEQDTLLAQDEAVRLIAQPPCARERCCGTQAVSFSRFHLRFVAWTLIPPCRQSWTIEARVPAPHSSGGWQFYFLLNSA